MERLKRDILAENLALMSQLEKKPSGFNFFSEENAMDLKRLLKLCGIPFVEAPFEAESQCAFLEMIGLVDGVITEDSDVLLFGARKVYRNVFEKNRLAERYDMLVIEKELGLDREDLMKLALFMGSDYTPGVRGIAAVNATEIISAFPGPDGLKRFKQWVDIKQQLIDREEGSSKKRRETEKEKMQRLIETALVDDPVDRADTEIEREYKEKHKNWRRHWEFPDDFPSDEVL